MMKKAKYLAVVLLAALMVTGCKNKKTAPAVNEEKSEETAVADTTVYGVCGDGTSMHSLELVTDAGDTLVYAVDLEDELTVKGGMLAGDRMAVVGYKDENGELVANNAINLTTLQGKWTSIDKNFEIQEGGVVKSNVKAESHPWTSWKICNAKLVLNRDTFAIDQLGADSLYLENKNGIFAYKRQR